MLTEVHTGDVIGIDAFEIIVEVDSRIGLPGFHLVGMASTAVTEGKVRIKTAVENSGFILKSKKITVNLAPAEIRKDTTAFDLPIALGVIAVDGSFKTDIFTGTLFIGELSLDGTVRPVHGALSITDMAARKGYSRIVVPRENGSEAALINGIEVCIADSLIQVMECLTGERAWENVYRDEPKFHLNDIPDFCDIRGQNIAIRAMEIAAAGGHNLLMIGPPGSGKSMLARRLPGILPPMDQQQAIECTKIYSVAGILKGNSLIDSRPCRNPHHTITSAGLVGGGPGPRPGEISLAHNGILFLDELLEFSRQTLETLRQPLENGNVTITRARGSISFPCNFQLIAAMNPCPCGHYGDPRKECICTNRTVEIYRNRLSGPLIDRIDIQIEVPGLTYAEIRSTTSSGEKSNDIRERVIKAWEIQQYRYRDEVEKNNARMNSRMIREYCNIDFKSELWLEKTVERNSLSVRSVDKILKIARTIADLGGYDKITMEHIKEASNLRTSDTKPLPKANNGFYA